MSAYDHGSGVVVHEGFGRDAEVAQHGVRLPLAGDLYDVAVYAAKDHCHGPTGAEGTRGYLLGAEADRLANASNAVADCFGDVMIFDDALLCVVMVASDRNLCGDASTL